ncbi:MAG: helix-turn-helix domain-containing protein [Candidatus Micrarchaeota archaeon]
MNLGEKLEHLGLNANEASVYLAMLETGTSPAGKIAVKAGINRTLVYNVLNSLIKNGLASYEIKNNIRYFTAARPERILWWINQRKELADSLVGELNAIAPKTIDETSEIFTGIEGVSTAIDLLFETGEEWYTIGSTGLLHEISPLLFNSYTKKRVKKKLWRWIITTRDKRKIMEKQEYSHIRYLPKEYVGPVSITICGDIVMILTPYQQQPTTFLIKSRDASRGFMNYFKLLWKIAKSE